MNDLWGNFWLRKSLDSLVPLVDDLDNKFYVFTELPSSSNTSAPLNGKNLSCGEKIDILPGCEIVDRRCQCWKDSIVVCRESSVTKWDFESAAVRKILKVFQQLLTEFFKFVLLLK